MGLACAVFAAFAPAENASAQGVGVRLLSFEQPLRLSRWWALGGLQQRLNTALAACGLSDRVVVDYKPGPGTGNAIAALRRCSDFAIAGEDGRRDLTVALWVKLFPDVNPPSAGDRIRALIFTFENTDYDEFLWNVGQPTDPTAWGTWGPFGATLAHGAEIQRVIDLVEKRNPGLVAQAFSDAERAGDARAPSTRWRPNFCAANPQASPDVSGYALLMSLGRPVPSTRFRLTEAERTNLRREFCDDARYRVWYGAFARLGDATSVRQAYDDLYAAQNRQIVSAFSRSYAQRSLPRTETDWAFFLDRATQFTPQTVAIGKALDEASGAGTPAERRLAVSRSHRPKKACPDRPDGICVQWKTRVGRDMAYVIDALGEGPLTDEERAAWQYYGRRRASSLGLDDVANLEMSPY